MVKVFGLSSVVLLTMLAGCSSAENESSTAPNIDDGTVSAQDKSSELAPWANGNGAHYHWTREENANREAKAARPNRSPNMTYHGGKIMTSVTSKAIFWGTSWGSYTGDKITGMDSWYSGHAGSNYAKTSDEYTGTNGQVGSTGTHQGHIIDTSAAKGGAQTTDILAEVCKQVTAGNIVPDPSGNGYYPVYTDVPRGSAGYCAYHGSGTCALPTGGSAELQYAFFWKLDGDAGCDPQDSSGLHSQGLAAIANVSGHELAEARTDASTISSTGAAAWYDSQGQENGDKCAWTFGAPLVTFSNGSKWKIQGEWSNAAYTAGTGYANSSGQKGCLGGL